MYSQFMMHGQKNIKSQQTLYTTINVSSISCESNHCATWLRC